MECFDWSAWYNRMPGVSDPNLHVSGHCRLRSSSIQAELLPGNEGIHDEPDLYVLDLTVHEPEIGDTRSVDSEVFWEGDVGSEIKRVRIQGRAQAEIDVIDAV